MVVSELRISIAEPGPHSFGEVENQPELLRLAVVAALRQIDTM